MQNDQKNPAIVLYSAEENVKTLKEKKQGTNEIEASYFLKHYQLQAEM